MTYASIAGLASGLLLFPVAYYALRLNRFLGTPRMGGVLCGGLSLLGVLSSLSTQSVFGATPSGIAAGAFQALASLAVVVGLRHVEKVLSEHVHARQAEEDARGIEEKKQVEAAFALEKKLTELTSANEQWPKTLVALQQQVAQLESEAADQKSLVAELKERNKQLEDAGRHLAEKNAQMTIAHEEELRRTSTVLQARVAEHERSRIEHDRLCSEQMRLRAEQERSQTQQVQLRAEIEKTSRQLADAVAACSAAQAAAQADTALLQNVRSLINDATASVGNVVGRAARFRSTNTSHITKLLRPAPAKKNGSRTPAPALGKRLPGSIAVLSRQLSREQSALVQQIESLKKKLERIQKIAGADAETTNGSHVLHSATTDTATTIEDLHDTARCTHDEVNGADNDHPVLN